jgi:hypothetical protein
MMAYGRSESPTGGRFPSEEVRLRLRTALAGFLAGDDRDESETCAALASLAAEAQARQLGAESMLVAFKRLWAETPEVQAITDHTMQQRTLERLVRLCIDAYYQR